MINPNHADGTNSRSSARFLYTDMEGEESKNHTVASQQGALQVFWLNWLHSDFCADLRHYFNKILNKSDFSGAKLNVDIVLKAQFICKIISLLTDNVIKSVLT